MRASLVSFTLGLNDLRKYIQAIELEYQLLATEVNKSGLTPIESSLLQFQNHISSFPSKRRFDYNSIIVSLYGFFEQYLESSLREYAAILNSIILRYDELPQQIVKRHVDLSFTLINRIEQTKYKSDATVPEIIANLHSCVTRSDGYKINAEAFAYHSANFRTEIVDEVFSRLAIFNVSRRILERAIFLEYLKSVHPDRNPQTIKFHEALFYLNDLADRRNDVAHGISSAILSNEILLSYIMFFEAYGQALYEVLRKEIIPHLALHRGINLGSPINVHDGRIVCIAVKNTLIKVGDTLIAKTPNNAYLASEIEEIQVENVSCNEVLPLPSIEIGMQVSFNAKRNQIFYLVPKHLRIV